MVIPVCFKCQSPVKIIADPQEGLEIISYYCADCDQSAASFLLGYVDELGLETMVETIESGEEEETIERAQLFGKANQHYKLRAKMQPLLDMRASGDGLLRPKPAKDSSDPE